LQNKWPILKGNLALQLCFVALLLYTVLLPFQPFFPPITSGIVAFWLVYLLSFQKERLALLLKNQYAQLWFFYYLILTLGLFYTSNPDEAAIDLVLKISLVLWPLGFASWPEPIIQYKSAILSVFAWSTVASAFALTVIGVSRWLEADADGSQLYQFMSIWDWLPNHYMAMYASFSVFIFIHLFLQKQHSIWISLLGISVLIVLIALTSVRIQFAALPLGGLFFLFFQKTSGPLKKRLALLSALGFCAVVGIAVLVPSSRSRLAETFDELRSINGMVESKQTNHRVYLWRYGADVIAENFWLGTGSGAANDALNEKLKDCPAKFWNGKRHYYLSEYQYNYHNAFLQHFATHGIIGFLIFVGIFVWPFFYRRHTINGLGAAFLAISAVSFFTESMLERQAGVLFFGFFYALLFVPEKSISGK